MDEQHQLNLVLFWSLTYTRSDKLDIWVWSFEVCAGLKNLRHSSEYKISTL